MADSGLIKFPDFQPDITPIGTGAGPVVTNVVPRADGYGPFYSLNAFTNALPGRCRGVYSGRALDGSITTIGATATDIYALATVDAQTFGWRHSGGPYTALPDTDVWQFTQFQNLVIAVQINANPQRCTMTGSNEFEDLPGSPPRAGHVATVNQFVVLSDISGEASRVQWSDIDNADIWTPGTGLSDFQDLQDGGFARHVAGGDNYGIVFQDGAVRSLNFAPGSPTTFNILRISEADGLLAEYSAINAGDKVFYYSYQGFRMILAGGSMVPIGKENVDRYFAADCNQDFFQLMVGAVDPTATRVYWPYKSVAAPTANLYADKIIGYDWMLKKWFVIKEQTIEMLLALSVPGITGAVED